MSAPAILLKVKSWRGKAFFFQKKNQEAPSKVVATFDAELFESVLSG